jgi:hypothetical protein
MGFARNSVSHSRFWRKGSLPEAGAPKGDGFLSRERNFGCNSGLARLGNTELWRPARTEPPLDPTLSKHTGNRADARGIKSRLRYPAAIFDRLDGNPLAIMRKFQPSTPASFPLRLESDSADGFGSHGNVQLFAAREIHSLGTNQFLQSFVRAKCSLYPISRPRWLSWIGHVAVVRHLCQLQAMGGMPTRSRSSIDRSATRPLPPARNQIRLGSIFRNGSRSILALDVPPTASD